MLDGEMVLMVDGQPDKTVKSGESYQVPPGAIHDAKIGPNGAKVIATYVVEKGRPLASRSSICINHAMAARYEPASQPTSRGHDGIVPVICPTRQMVSEHPRATPAVAGYVAWGCFRYFVWALSEASGRT
jgi:hypothetical protein